MPGSWPSSLNPWPISSSACRCVSNPWHALSAISALRSDRPGDRDKSRRRTLDCGGAGGVIGAKRRGARPFESACKCNRGSIHASICRSCRSLKPSAQQLLILLTQMFSAAAGPLVFQAGGVGRVKNVTSAVTRLITPSFRGFMSRKEHSKRDAIALVPLVAVEYQNYSVTVEAISGSSLIRENSWVAFARRS